MQPPKVAIACVAATVIAAVTGLRIVQMIQENDQQKQTWAERAHERERYKEEYIRG